MTRHPYEYGEECVSKIIAEKLVQKANLSPIDLEILYLRMACEWQYEEIAKYIGETYYGRTKDNPLWERSIRYRLEKAIKKLQQVAKSLRLDEDY